MTDLITRLEALDAKIDEVAQMWTISQGMDFFVESSGFPMWMKDKHLRMIFINDAYTEFFGVSLQDYVNKKDSDNWQEEYSSEYNKYDKVVLETGEPRFAIEYVGGRSLLVYKFPVRDSFRDVIGVGGICVLQDMEAQRIRQDVEQPAS